MKLASYRDGSRDGQLVVVSRDLATAHYASGIADRLQQVLDDWNFLSPQLEDLSRDLNAGRVRHAFPFDPRQCLAPLPRAYQWVCAAAYPLHGALALGAVPQLRQCASDELLGPCDDVLVQSETQDVDLGAGLAVITGDVRRGASAEQALAGVRLLMLAASVHLRQYEAAEGVAWGGAGLPVAGGFSPVAVTPDELGEAWRGGRVHLTLQVARNGRRIGLCDCGPEMAWGFGALVAQLARTRNVRAGSIVGSGTVGNREGSRGHACIADKRALEQIEAGAPRTDYLRFGDQIHIDIKGPGGHSLCGAVQLQIAEAPAPAAPRGKHHETH